MTETNHDPSPQKPRWRLLWFPYCWTVLLVGLGWFAQMGDGDPGIKNWALYISAALILLGFSLWFLFCGGLRLRRRMLLVLIPWSILVLFSTGFQPVWNASVGIVGFRWRWSPPHDHRLTSPEISSSGAADWQETEHDYPRFLGKGPWAEATSVRLNTDWKSHPPIEKWRCKVGASWSGFAIVGNYAITQEQRGEAEMVLCYRVDTDLPQGEVVWTHSDPVRWDPSGPGAMGKVGPRATPTIYQRKVITQGATGIVNCLDALTGDRIWSHDTLAKHGSNNVLWGKSGSPLVVPLDNENALVVISVGGKDGYSLVAYDLATGDVVWHAGDAQSSYASPVLATLAGEQQILSVNQDVLTAHRVSDGQVLWEHPWLGDSGSNASNSQPVPLPGDRVFLSKGYGIGASLLQVQHDRQGHWSTQPLWRPVVKTVMKTKLSNVVIRDGFVYGLDDELLSCVELKTGKRRWKKRRRPKLGYGQVLLVGDVILVLSEQGELVLVKASPKKYRELASMQAIEGVTWNTPALAGKYLLVRNAEEAACYELPLLPQE